MHTFIRFLVLFVFTISVTSAIAEVYKRTNPDGSVEFTDVPGSDKEKPVPLSPMSTFKAQPLTLPQTRSSQQQTSPYTYTEIRITSPADETTIRDNTGTINVSVSVSPALHPEHKLALLVDGEQKGESASGSFTLTNIDRGSHSLTAQVLDKTGNTLISTTPVTVHLFRQSVIKATPFK